jgi:hypothetical protein
VVGHSRAALGRSALTHRHCACAAGWRPRCGTARASGEEESFGRRWCARGGGVRAPAEVPARAALGRAVRDLIDCCRGEPVRGNRPSWIWEWSRPDSSYSSTSSRTTNSTHVSGRCTASCFLESGVEVGYGIGFRTGKTAEGARTPTPAGTCTTSRSCGFVQAFGGVAVPMHRIAA